MRWWVLGVVAVTLACGGGKQASQPAATASSTNPTGPAPAPTPVPSPTPAPAPVASPPAETPASPPPPSGPALPALDFADVGNGRMKKARALNKEGLAKHRAQDYPGAATSYLAAVRADPGHLLARYNLACVYNLAGRSDEGLAILKTIKDKGCPTCLGQLIHARTDKDWQSQWAKPRFKAVTGDIKVPKLDLEQATKAVIKAIETGKLEPIAHLLPPRAAVVHTYTGMLCEGAGCDPRYVHRAPAGMAALIGRLHKAVKTYPEPDGMQMMYDRLVCDKSCCRLENDESVASHAYSNLGAVCFKAHPGGVVLLTRIKEWGD